MSFFPSGEHSAGVPGPDPGDAGLDADFPIGDGTAEMEAEVTCPYCLEPVTLALDPGSGAHQEYVEEGQVCCRPWNVHVSHDDEGRAGAWVEAADEVDGE